MESTVSSTLAQRLGTELPSHADLVRFLGMLADREDVHARQWANGTGSSGYSPVHEPLTARRLREYLAGDVTLGVFPVRRDGTVTFDVVRRWAQLERRRLQLENEVSVARDDLLVRLASQPGSTVQLPEGEMSLVHEAGVPCLQWRPASGAPEPGSTDAGGSQAAAPAESFLTSPRVQ